MSVVNYSYVELFLHTQFADTEGDVQLHPLSPCNLDSHIRSPPSLPVILTPTYGPHHLSPCNLDSPVRYEVKICASNSPWQKETIDVITLITGFMHNYGLETLMKSSDQVDHVNHQLHLSRK